MNRLSILIATFIFTSLTLIFLPFYIEAATWSQTSQTEFATNSLSNVDISTNPDAVQLSGAYSTDTNTIFLMHFNEGSGNPNDSSGYGNNGTNSGASPTFRK